MEAAGIEPASDPGRNDGHSSGFVARFDLDGQGDVTVKDNHLTVIAKRGRGRFVVLIARLDAAIPLLEQILEAAKLAYNGHTQEVG